MRCPKLIGLNVGGHASIDTENLPGAPKVQLGLEARAQAISGIIGSGWHHILHFSAQLRAVHTPSFIVLLGDRQVWKFGRHDPSWAGPRNEAVLGKVSDTHLTQKVFIEFETAVDRFDWSSEHG